DVLHPCGKPGDLVVVHHGRPLATVWRRRHRRALANVNGNVLGTNAPLHHAHLWMVAAPAEQSRRLHFVVGDTLTATVHDGIAVLFDFFQLLLLYSLLLLLCHGLLLLPLGHVVFVNWREVANVEGHDLRTLRRQWLSQRA